MTKLSALRSYLEKHGAEYTLNKILTEFYSKMSKDIMVGYFFQDKDLGKIVKGQLGLLLSATGIQPQYEGRGVHAAHLSLPAIRRGHFFRRLKLLEKTLEEFELPDESRKEWLEFERQFESILVKE